MDCYFNGCMFVGVYVFGEVVGGYIGNGRLEDREDDVIFIILFDFLE